ncbi:MAG: bifunctional riboflavin kinase/FAD synthetase [Ignavibacteriales bacterium]|nr:bifunctional riboflavin kinase/FAD synthetase [Ignavibacteriales bacterium]
MKIFQDILQVSKKKNTVLTIGTFDGFHLGHQKIMEQVIIDTNGRGGRSLVITFEPHPRNVISKDYNLKLLTSTEEKISLIKKAGIENILIIKFSEEFSKLTAEEFIRDYIVAKIGASELVIGHDHRLGRDRIGDESKLKELGKQFSFDVAPVNAVKINGEIVSSTIIRAALLEGNIDKANAFLGRSYSFSGKVVTGAMRGRELGFPTANIELDENQKLVPANGIYIVEFFVNSKKHFGLMNIGTRPTFEDSLKVVIEVYLYDFNNDIYGKNVSVNIIHRMREELKYPAKEELIAQMEIDKIKGLEIIKRLTN